MCNLCEELTHGSPVPADATTRLSISYERATWDFRDEDFEWFFHEPVKEDASLSKRAVNQDAPKPDNKRRKVRETKKADIGCLLDAFN